MAQLSSQYVALSHRNVTATSGLNSPKILTWLPLASILLGIVSLFHLVQMSDVASTGYNIQELQSDEAGWKVRNEQLALEVARAKSLSVIEDEATHRLGMIWPKETVYLRPSTELLASRASPISRGEPRDVPELGKPVQQGGKSLIMIIQQALASALAPRWQR